MKKLFQLIIPVAVALLVVVAIHRGNRIDPMEGTAYAAGVNVNQGSIPAGAGTASFTVNWAVAPYFRMSPSASPTAFYSTGDATFTNPVDGQVYVFEWDEDATGEGFGFPSQVVAPGGINAAPTIPSLANLVEIVTMVYNSTLNKYVIQSITSNMPQTNLHNNCATTFTLSAGVFTTTGAGACFTNYSRIGWNPLGGGTPATLTTPTGTTSALNARIQCAQSAANSQTITCVSADAVDTHVVQVYGIN